MRTERLIGKFRASLALLCLPLLVACAMIQIAQPTPGPGTPTTGPTSTPEPSQTPSPDRQATLDAARFRETVQAFQTESAAQNATERAATARPTGTETQSSEATFTPIPDADLVVLNTSNIANLEQLDIFQIDPIEKVTYHQKPGFLEIATTTEFVLYQAQALNETRRYARPTISALAISEDGTLAVIGAQDGSVVVENLRTGESRLYTDEFLGISATAISPDNRLVAALTMEGDLKLWDRQTGDELVSFFTRFYFDYASFGTWLSFSPVGERIAAFADQSNSLLVWELDSLLGNDVDPEFVAWRQGFFEAENYLLAPDWSTSLWWEEDTAQLFELSGQPRAEALLFPAKINGAGFNTDSSLFFTAFNENRNGQLFGTIQAHSGETAAAHFSFAQPSAITAWLPTPGGRQVAIGYQDGGLILWDATTGQPVYELNGHTGAVTNLAFSPDGKILASAARDATLRFWGVSSGGALATLPASAGGRAWMEFSASGKLIAIASDFGQVRLLGVRP